MKFATDQDAQMFLVEIERSDLIDGATKDLVPTDEMLEAFVQKRRGIISQMKDFRRRQMSAQQWRTSRYKIMRGIKRFHKSTAGRKFHRKLGRFLATRDTANSFAGRKDEGAFLLVSEVAEVLMALSSLRTHALIEVEYFHPLSEELEYRMFLEELIPTINRIEKGLFSGSFELSEADEEFLARVVNHNDLLLAMSEAWEVPFQDVAALWERMDAHLQSTGVTEEDEFYARILVDDVRRIYSNA